MRQRKHGVWEVRVYLGRDPGDGHKRYRSRTVRGSKRDAQRVARELVCEAEEAAAIEAPPQAPDDESVSAWLDRWWVTKQRQLSPSSVSPWRSAIERYLKPELGALGLHEVRPHHLEDLYESMVDAGLSASPVRNVHTVASVAFKAAARRGLIAASPAALATPPSGRRPEPDPPTPAEVRRLLEAAAGADLDLFDFLVVAANTGRGVVRSVRSDGATSTREPWC